MPNEIKIYIVEEIGLKGTGLSCYTKRMKKGSPLYKHTKYYSFASKDEFRDGLCSALSAINAAENSSIKLLIISAHGVPRTGTLLDIPGTDENINMHDYQRCFEELPEKVVIYLSSCWGAYPSLIQACTGSEDNKPRLIGPLVSIEETHSKNIQNKIINLLLEQGISEPKFIELIDFVNKEYCTTYMEKCLRFVDREGNSYPGPNEIGLSAPVEKRKKFRLVSLHKQPKAACPLPIHAIFWDGQSFWQASMSKLYRIEDDSISNCDAYKMIGRYYSIRYKVSEEKPIPININRMEILDAPKIIQGREVPEYLESFPFKYIHSESALDSDINKYERKDELRDADSPCLSCTQAYFEWENIVSENRIRITRYCANSGCPEHFLDGD